MSSSTVLGPEGVAHLGPVEGDPHRPVLHGAVVGDVGEVEVRHLLPGGLVEQLGNHGPSLRDLGEATIRRQAVAVTSSCPWTHELRRQAPGHQETAAVVEAVGQVLERDRLVGRHAARAPRIVRQGDADGEQLLEAARALAKRQRSETRTLSPCSATRVTSEGRWIR